jgi:diguanylate cyclase (GGDEF)-like protein
MNPTLTRANVWTTAVRNYWWFSSVIGAYFAGSFWWWRSSKPALLSSIFFLVVALIGLAFHYRVHWHRRWPQVALIVAHLLLAQSILAWQKFHLPLSDYTNTGNPAIRDLLIYLVSTLIMGALSVFGGIWGAAAGLFLHYVFIFDIHEEFSFKWIFPICMVMTGGIVSSAFWRLDRANEQLEILANRDNLTGLLNRHRLEPEFERLQKLACENKQSLLLMAWDLDGLKQVNDQQGHAAGDECIRAFATALQANVRRISDTRFGDAAFRVGGDEFISMHLDACDGELPLRRVHQSCPSVSAGWVLCDSLTLDQALTQADQALYSSKEQRKKALAAAK